MKKNFVYFLIIFLIIILYFQNGCKQSPVEPNLNGNLLSNGSFEVYGVPSLDGWFFGNKQLAKLVDDAPRNDGKWSLQLTSDWAPTLGYAYTPVFNLKSGDVVKLSAYVRVTGKYGGRAIIYLSYGKHSKSASCSDTVWNEISIIDTLDLLPSDTLLVTLSAPVTEIVPFQQRFDCVKLEKIVK